MILTQTRSSEVAERIREAVEQALAAQNVSARRASIDVVGHDGLIRDIRAGRLPSVDRVEALFDYLGLEAYFGPKRYQGRPPALRLVQNATPDDEAPSGFSTIPWAEPLLGVGSAPVCFSRAWLDEHELKIDFLQAVLPDLVEVDGIESSDTLAVVDSRAGLRNGHSLWCYRRSGKVRVAHVTFAGDVTVLHSARAEEPPTVLEGDLSRTLDVVGKVVWLGHSIPLKGQVG